MSGTGREEMKLLYIGWRSQALVLVIGKGEVNMQIGSQSGQDSLVRQAVRVAPLTLRSDLPLARWTRNGGASDRPLSDSRPGKDGDKACRRLTLPPSRLIPAGLIKNWRWVGGFLRLSDHLPCTPHVA